jgi:hypothetical protein
LVLGLFWMVRQQGLAAPSGYLYNLPDDGVEAAYCLAVAERIKEITGGRAERVLERHLDEQISFWRGRADGAYGPGRTALARDSHAPGVNEGAHLHLAVQDCAHRAIAYYGQRFSPMSG